MECMECERVCMYAYVEPLYAVWSVLSMMMMYGVYGVWSVYVCVEPLYGVWSEYGVYGVWSVYGVRRTLSGVNLVAHVIRVQQPSEDVVHRGGVVRLRPCRHRRRRRDRRLRCQLRL